MKQGKIMDEKTRLIQELDTARAHLQAALDQVSRKAEIYPHWTLKELLAHLTGWDEAVTASLRAHAGGREPAVPASRGINLYNAQSVETREALSYEQVVRECQLAREQLKAALNALPPEKFSQPMVFPWGQSGAVEKLVRVFVEHDEEHTAEIRAHNL